MRTIYLIVGCPGSGKTTIGEKLQDKFHFVRHDDFMHDEPAYARSLWETTRVAPEKPVLGEIPFGLSKIQEDLESRDVKVVPVFIIENPLVIAKRYLEREGKQIPPGHLTRQKTYAQRAAQLKAFSGTAAEVLEHLRAVKA